MTNSLEKELAVTSVCFIFY